MAHDDQRLDARWSVVDGRSEWVPDGQGALSEDQDGHQPKLGCLAGHRNLSLGSLNEW